jgi:hypothetical protein
LKDLDATVILLFINPSYVEFPSNVKVVLIVFEVTICLHPVNAYFKFALVVLLVVEVEPVRMTLPPREQFPSIPPNARAILLAKVLLPASYEL